MGTTVDPMSPDSSPSRTGKGKWGVRRVNQLPMILIGVALMAFLVVMAMVAADRAKPVPTAEPPKTAGNTATFAKQITGDRTDGMVAAVNKPNVPDLPTLAAVPAAPDQIIVTKNLDSPPVPPSRAGTPSSNSHGEDEADRIRMSKLQVLTEAAKARTGVQIIAPRSAGSGLSDTGTATGQPLSRNDMIQKIAAVRQQITTNGQTNPAAAYQERLAQIRGVGSTADGVGTSGGAGLFGGGATPASGSNGAYSAFDADQSRWKTHSTVEAPGSPFEMRAGFVIPATLISGINSDLPGQIVAQISQNVFDTATGKYLLLPQGSRLVGSYASSVAYGQSRVLVAWQRIIFPDGKALDIGAMPGADGAGYAGFEDKVNNHYFRIFGSALLMSVVTAGVTLSQDSGATSTNVSDRQRASDALSEALGQQLGQAMAQMLAKNLSIAPTLEIRPGFRFNVVVTKDLTFSKPYEAFDY